MSMKMDSIHWICSVEYLCWVFRRLRFSSMDPLRAYTECRTAAIRWPTINHVTNGRVQLLVSPAVGDPVLVAKLTTSQLVTHEITERFVVTHSRSCCVGFIPKATGGTPLDVGATTDKKTLLGRPGVEKGEVSAASYASRSQDSGHKESSLRRRSYNAGRDREMIVPQKDAHGNTPPRSKRT